MLEDSRKGIFGLELTDGYCSTMAQTYTTTAENRNEFYLLMGGKLQT
jgi:hypothetical protein